MRQRIRILGPGDAPEERSIEAPVSAGGSRADPVHLPGLPPAALRLEPGPAGLVVAASAAGARACGRPLPPGARRLLRSGERVELFGVALQLLGPPRRAEGTRAAAAGLLAEAARGAAPLAWPHLVVLTGPAAGRRCPLDAEATIGRGRGATIRLPDPRASRLHARVRLDGGHATVEDLGSKNGLRLNGVPIDRRTTPLLPGDEIELGETSLALEDPLAPVDGGEAAVPLAREAEAAAAAGPPLAQRLPPARLAAAALLTLAAALALAGS